MTKFVPIAIGMKIKELVIFSIQNSSFRIKPNNAVKIVFVSDLFFFNFLTKNSVYIQNHPSYLHRIKKRE